jgi:hypothetical protein
VPTAFALADEMLALVVDVLPVAWKHASYEGVVGRAVLGAALMLARNAVLEV